MQDSTTSNHIHDEPTQFLNEIDPTQISRKNKIASLATTVIVHLFIGLVLYLIVISLGKNEIPQIVAVMETHDDTPQIERKDFAKKVKKKPQPAQSAARINPISATTVSSISVPAFEDPVVDPLGIGTDFDGFTDPPDEITDMGEIPRITKYLKCLTGKGGEQKYSDEVISKFLGGNALRVLREGWR